MVARARRCTKAPQLVDPSNEVWRLFEVEELRGPVHDEQHGRLHEVERQIVAELSLLVVMRDEGPSEPSGSTRSGMSRP